jgi:hypothetical protein
MNFPIFSIYFRLLNPGINSAYDKTKIDRAEETKCPFAMPTNCPPIGPGKDQVAETGLGYRINDRAQRYILPEIKRQIGGRSGSVRWRAIACMAPVGPFLSHSIV